MGPRGLATIVALALLLIALTSCASAMAPNGEPGLVRVENAQARLEGGAESSDERVPSSWTWRPAVGSSLKPPTLVRPERVKVSPRPSSNELSLEPDKDYIIDMPDEPVTRGLILSGGRNVVMIGGEIAIPWQGPNPSIAQRTGLKIRGATGIVHVEGLLLRGEDISEGIQIDAPQAIVQLQNVGVFGIHARDQKNFSDNHPDVIQTYGNVRELRVDGLTGTTDYQGLMLKVDFDRRPHGPVDLRNVNIVGRPTARYMIWFGTERGFGDVRLENVWIDVPPERGGTLERGVWPSPAGSYPAQAIVDRQGDGIEYAEWPDEMEPTVLGRVFEGVPPRGDFVDPDAIGIGYRR